MSEPINQESNDNASSVTLDDGKTSNWIEPIYHPIDGIVQPITVPPAEKLHRNTNQLKYLSKILNTSLLKYKFSEPFRQPVNTIEWNIPDYYTVIKQPMDLNTIKKRLENYFYYSAEECIKDFQLIFDNCYRFNTPKHCISSMAKSLENTFKLKLENMPEPEIELEMVVKKNLEIKKKRKRKRTSKNGIN